MSISNDTAAKINATYANPNTVAEITAALGGASGLVSTPRIVTISGPVSSTSDYRMFVNATTGTPSLSLPYGANGRSFAIAHHPSNTVAWSLTPSGADTISAPLAAAMVAKTNLGMQYLDGVWHLV